MLLRSFLFLLLLPFATALAPAAVTFDAYAPPADAWCSVRDAWVERLLAEHPDGRLAPLRFEPTDDDLRALGLPSRAFLQSHRFGEPTLALPDGSTQAVDPVVLAGPGCVGLRPGGILLTLTPESVGWCTLGFALGSPGSYQFTTAGSCGNVGDVATTIAAVGNRGGAAGVVLLDFGRFVKSDPDLAILSVDARWQGIVSPTVCAWGGPLGVFTGGGAQTLLAYGQGAPPGPRVGEALSWSATRVTYFGHAAPGDAGSPLETLLGDDAGATREAAALAAHVYVDPLLRDGVGNVVATRVSQLGGSIALGGRVP